MPTGRSCYSRRFVGIALCIFIWSSSVNREFHMDRIHSASNTTGLCAGNSPGLVNSPHKGPVTRKMFPFDDVIMVWTKPTKRHFYLSLVTTSERRRFVFYHGCSACLSVCMPVCLSVYLPLRENTWTEFNLIFCIVGLGTMDVMENLR